MDETGNHERKQVCACMWPTSENRDVHVHVHVDQTFRMHLNTFRQTDSQTDRTDCLYPASIRGNNCAYSRTQARAPIYQHVNNTCRLKYTKGFDDDPKHDFDATPNPYLMCF